ncbi:hypothetical protein BHM03_00017971 [Ensete ventricosum]|uniref:Uncharacterized protein n=1 Tax=Ensete ventricosum TaxID=4639 RepID=A0A445MF60_ENSVE|nr:hypothetical protein BHM03_00017971 [Ensete ventricosum]
MDCPNPSCSLLPPLRRRRRPCAGAGYPCPQAAAPTVGATAPAGDCPGHWGHPLRADRWRLPLAGWPLAVTPCGRPATGRPCERRAASDSACGWLLALGASSHPLVEGLHRSRSPLCREPWP